MLFMLIMLMVMVLVGIIKLSLSLAWGLTKFIFGLGLFLICPLIFILAVLLGAFSQLWLPILIIGLIFGKGFRIV